MQARMIIFSKEENEPYPKLGKGRPIAILPAITKLYEQVIYIKLKTEIEMKAPISEK